MNKPLFSVISILMLAAILLLLNGLGQTTFSGFSYDLTEHKLYSLSEGTKRILDKIEEPLTLRLYASQGRELHPAIDLYGKRVRDLLKEYKKYAKDKLIIEYYNPVPDTEEEDWALKYGLKAIQLSSNFPIYLGLYGSNALGDEELIPFFQLGRQQFIEYDISKLISNLGKVQRAKIGIISSIDFNYNQKKLTQNSQERPPHFLDLLSENADLVFIKEQAQGLPRNLDLVLLIHPRNVNSELLYAIDQYLVSGKNLFVAIDPNCESCHQATGVSGLPPVSDTRDSDLDALLSSWGVEFKSKIAVGDTNLSTKINIQRGFVKDFILWLSILRKGEDFDLINKEHQITSELDSLIFPWAGSLRIREVEGLDIQPLISTTSQTKLYSPEEYLLNFASPDELLNNFKSSEVRENLALSLKGKFKATVSPVGLPKEAKRIHKSSSDHVSEVVVVSDVDFLFDRFSIARQRFFDSDATALINDNLVFFQNVVEHLSGSIDLISLRSRGQFSRPFYVIQEIEKNAKSRWFEEEIRLQKELSELNLRVRQLLGNQGDNKFQTTSKQMLNRAMFAELRKFKDEESIARKRLREIRRKSREEIESLQNKIFLLNTFAIPVLLIFFTLFFYKIRRTR